MEETTWLELGQAVKGWASHSDVGAADSVQLTEVQFCFVFS